MDAATRLAFNIKVLRRHDPLISEIVESASFVVLYEHVDQQWQKMGIEGPMFLYKRTAAPTYGFFILNRNGLENFSKSLVPEDELEMTDNFIIYQDAKVDRVLGLWVYEAEHLTRLGQQMLKLKNLHPGHSDGAGIFAGPSTAPASTTAAPAQTGQSISLDAIFGSARQPPASSAGPSSSAQSNGLSLLDSIFKSAAGQDPRPPSASQLPVPVQQSTPSTAVHAPRDDSEGLKALLGLGPAPSMSDAPPSTSEATRHQSQSAVAPGLEALFASARLSPNNSSKQTLAPAPVPQPAQQTHANGDQRWTYATAVDQGLAGRKLGEQTLSRSDFVRELLSLIHTDPAFVNDVYQRYLTRVT